MQELVKVEGIAGALAGGGAFPSVAHTIADLDFATIRFAAARASA